MNLSYLKYVNKLITSQTITKMYAKLLTFPLAILNNNFIIIGKAVIASWKFAFFFITSDILPISFLRWNRSVRPLFSAILF